jgi:hypothetical protein
MSLSFVCSGIFDSKTKVLNSFVLKSKEICFTSIFLSVISSKSLSK